MIRTVWLAVPCSIGLGAMVAIDVGPPVPKPNVETAPEQTTIAAGSSDDTLTKADKLEIAYVPVPVEPVVLARPVSEETSPQPRSLVIRKIVSRHSRERTARKLAAVSPDRRINIQQPKRNGKGVDRAKATVDLRPCRRPEGFAGLLRALNLSPGCDA